MEKFKKFSKNVIAVFVAGLIGIGLFAPLNVVKAAEEDIIEGHNDDELVSDSTANVCGEEFNIVFEDTDEPTGNLQFIYNQYVDYIHCYIGLPYVLDNDKYYDISFDLTILRPIESTSIEIRAYNQGTVEFDGDVAYEIEVFDNYSIIHFELDNISNSREINPIGKFYITGDYSDNSVDNNFYLNNFVATDVTKEVLFFGNFFQDINLVVDHGFNWVSQIADTIVQTPILLITTGFLVLGACIGLFGRFICKD